MEAVEPTETRIASVSRDVNGVITIRMKDCGMIDEFDVMDLNLVIRHQAEGKPRLKLLIATGDWDLSKNAKKMAMKEDHLSQTRARAVVVSGGIKASLKNFLDQFTNKPYPLQYFKDRDEAYAWLMSL